MSIHSLIFILSFCLFFFFFNDTATTEIYTLSLHDALPICACGRTHPAANGARDRCHGSAGEVPAQAPDPSVPLGGLASGSLAAGLAFSGWLLPRARAAMIAVAPQIPLEVAGYRVAARL